MKQEQIISPIHYSRWTHGFAVLLVVMAFPLIWVGGLVTTYGAGMAVPDWPNTYGWNMFLYPPSSWIYGGFDLLVEHGHRLLATLVGLITICLWISAIKTDSRRWFRWWCSGVLLAVILQGGLGGARVLLDERIAAMIHGCAAQLFLAMATGTAVMCSRWWLADTGSSTSPNPCSIASPKQPASRFLACTVTWLLVIAYIQVIAGASLRHIPISATPGAFMGIVHVHLMFAGLVFVTALIATYTATWSPSLWGGVKKPIFLILVTVFLQISLGFGTWLANYALPWQELTEELASYTLTSKGYWESMIITGHVATGALLISLLTLTTVRAWRGRSIWRKSHPVVQVQQ